MWLRAVRQGAIFKKIDGVYAVFYWNQRGLSQQDRHTAEVARIRELYKDLLPGKDGLFNLIVTLYNEKNPERLEEYKLCLEKNFSNPSIAKICIVYDTSSDDESNLLYCFLHHSLYPRFPHIIIVNVPSRPSFKQLFEVANTMFTERNTIIANGDIYFDETLSGLKTFDFSNTVVALTRRNLTKNNELESQLYMLETGEMSPCYMSYDAWMFRTPFKAGKITVFYWGLGSVIV